VIFFFAGGLIPLAFFPESFLRVLKFLPFKYIFDLPVSIFLHFNQLSPLDLAKGLLIQLFWIVVIWKIGDFVFDRSVKHNQSVGI
jgi:ABC-2 type transport system permease protein